MLNKDKPLKDALEKTPIKASETKRIERPLPIWPKGLTMSGDERMTISLPEDLAIVLSLKAFQQLFGWAYATSREISCLGSIRRDGNEFVVEEFFLLQQGGSYASTEIDEKALGDFMEKLLAEGKMDQMSRIKCWAHSHPGMGVFWSGTDENTCKLLVNEYLVSVVISDGFTVLGRIDVAGPVPISLDHVPVLYELPQDKELRDKFAAEVKSAVSERFHEFDFGIGNGSDAALTGKVGGDPEAVGAFYCEACGNFHGPGQCPMEDEVTVRRLVDENWGF
jgi:hypothetical protein